MLKQVLHFLLPDVKPFVRWLRRVFDRTPLEQRIVRAFPERSREYTLRFFEEYRKYDFPEFALYQYAIRSADDFYRLGCFCFEELPEDKGEYWILADDFNQYEWEIIHEKSSGKIALKNLNGPFEIPLADNFAQFADNIRESGTPLVDTGNDYGRISNEKRQVLETVFDGQSLEVALQMYAEFNDDMFSRIYDLSTKQRNGFDYFTKENFFERANFIFDTAFSKPEKFEDSESQWYIIGFGVECEDTGPCIGSLFSNAETGDIVYCEGNVISSAFTIAGSFEELIEKIYARINVNAEPQIKNAAIEMLKELKKW